MARTRKSEGNAHSFGGEWTSTKLDILGKYLAAYTKALHDKPTAERPFRKAYIDAFAGTGYRVMSRTGSEIDAAKTKLNLDLPDLAEPAPQQLLDGSARIALKVEPHFDSYIFIEQRKEHVRKLEDLKDEFPDLASRIKITRGDANTELKALCAKRGWAERRAVMFLDPYGMQVEWETIEAIAKTKAIDLWLLFPLGIGVNRLMMRRLDAIPDGWKRRLDTLLGTQSWRDELYAVDGTQTTLFGGAERNVNVGAIGRYFNERLRTIFAGVADSPAVLRNSADNPLYLFCFAAANENGAKTACRIANSLLKKFS
ncbi:MAG: three-Cys-motif partner protein TcmP [Gemmatimonadaceae bacterium]|nr:three-Cys-motif partner protein TcmP [Gemmatimonadaceae bacterium]